MLHVCVLYANLTEEMVYFSSFSCNERCKPSDMPALYAEVRELNSEIFGCSVAVNL